MILDSSKIEYINFNERDVEVPALISVLENFRPASVLDVGAHYSWYTYANKARLIISSGGYEALDLVDDAKTAEIVNKYHIADVTKFSTKSLRKYDLVSAISVIEHVGIQPARTPDAYDSRRKFLESVLALSGKAAFLTFPYGAGGWYPGECMIVTNEELENFESIGAKNGFSSECQFFYSPFPQGREKWVEMSRLCSSEVPLKPELGCTCVGLLLFKKEVENAG